MSRQDLKIGITQGDTNGVGWELILKIFADSRMCEVCTPIIYGTKSAYEFYKKSLKQCVEQMPNLNIINSAREAKRGKINMVECAVEKLEITPGTASPVAGTAAVVALKKCAQELKQGILDAMVTAPFNKESVQSEEFNFTGHTEFMSDMFDGNSMMMMCSERLRVGLVTKHIPVNEIGKSISSEQIANDIANLRRTLIADFAIVEPRIAVLALNPHAGDGGLLGKEEINIIKPAIVDAYKAGAMAFGPFAADGFFAAATYTKYDAVLAIYHDQGLIPFKTLSPEGVNFTAGLSAVRTSPDHGVAYDIAGKGTADESSMRNAIYMAIDVVNSRRTYVRMSANPLQRAERERAGRDLSVKDMPNLKEDHN